MEYIKLVIDKTSKGYNDKEGYTIFDQETKVFESLDQAKTWLSNEYGDCKKVKMFIDDKEGNSSHVGWIYCFNNKDWSHDSKSWHQQDWVTLSKVNESRIIL